MDGAEREKRSRESPQRAGFVAQVAWRRWALTLSCVGMLASFAVVLVTTPADARFFLRLVASALLPCPRMLTQLLVLSVIPTANSRMQGQPLKELKDPDTFTALYYTPPPSNEPLPLLLYLHGAGEDGNNVRDLISEGATGTRRRIGARHGPSNRCKELCRRRAADQSRLVTR